jgi:hypothetical protein
MTHGIRRSFRSTFAGVALLFLALAVAARAQITVSDLTSTFNAVVTNTGAIMTDPFNDQQTGQKSSDIISLTAGTSVYVNGAASATTLASDAAGLFVKAGTISGVNSLMFRYVMHDANGSKVYLGGYIGLGIDLRGDGTPDIFIVVDSTAATAKFVFEKAGTGANTSPNTTTAATYTTSASTALTTGTTFAYAATAVTYDAVASAGTQNMNFTFAISYATLSQAISDMGTVNGYNFSGFTVTSSTSMNFFAFSSQQANAYNQDIYGGNITSTATASWSSLGAFSTAMTADGKMHPIPEVGTMVQTGVMILLGGGLALWRRRQAQRTAG